MTRCHGDGIGQDARRTAGIAAHRRIDGRLAIGRRGACRARDQATTAGERAGQVGVVAIGQHRQAAHHLRGRTRGGGCRRPEVVADGRRRAGIRTGIGQRRAQRKATNGDTGRLRMLLRRALRHHLEVTAVADDHVVADRRERRTVVRGGGARRIGGKIDATGARRSLGIHPVASRQGGTSRRRDAHVTVAADIGTIPQRRLQIGGGPRIHHHRAYCGTRGYGCSQAGGTDGAVGACSDGQR